MVLGGFAGAMCAAAALTWLLLRATRGLRGQGFSWRHGVANLRRRAVGSTVQVVALGIGLMALLVLTIIRHDLLQAWQTSLPPEAPNRFIVNIQPDQVAALEAFFARHGMREPAAVSHGARQAHRGSTNAASRPPITLTIARAG